MLVQNRNFDVHACRFYDHSIDIVPELAFRYRKFSMSKTRCRSYSKNGISIVGSGDVGLCRSCSNVSILFHVDVIQATQIVMLSRAWDNVYLHIYYI